MLRALSVPAAWPKLLNVTWLFAPPPAVAKQEVRMVEHVEGLPLELHVHTFGEVERLSKGHVSG